MSYHQQSNTHVVHAKTKSKHSCLSEQFVLTQLINNFVLEQPLGRMQNGGAGGMRVGGLGGVEEEAVL